ncbi:ABC transporter substrate-binding protein [Desulfallas thermosapovorans]|uniref:Amino acid/amide ABC transporter substrate-binding protein (HAAT family) n=1 Tax=Desulfallas thermosapovorans DSM 6562 TaxID=1121431 RepID=A0A5S4ZYX3_9FIRM|nr:ABC transporter substrate-binding protein [Desulfallas thermosapovorans]TYO97341.1 amino acid/amide ABC transporter substrate-binding protein (HAAT family) [Desulfallas thermosapovorans DSM 6562]
MRQSKWFLFLLVAVMGLALLVSGCGGTNEQAGGAGDDKVVKIGLMTPLQGDVKTYGESVQKGFELALEEANYKAGDYTIEKVVADDRNDATEATNVATKLIDQDQVDAIVGSVTSKCTIPASSMAQAKGVVMISPTGTAAKVTMDPERKDYVFRACFIDPFQGTVAAKFAVDELQAKTAAIMFDQGNDYTVGLSQAFKEEFEKAGGQIVAEEAYAKEDVDFSAVLTNISKQKPDILYLPDYYQKVSLIGKQARDKGITAVFLGGDGWDSSDLDFATMDGGYFTAHYSSDDPRPEVANWVTKYKEKYNTEPDSFATLAYDATKLLLKAIEDANSNDPAKIKDAMQAIKDFPVVSGNITFDADGNPVKSAAILQVQKDGSYKFVTNVQP